MKRALLCAIVAGLATRAFPADVEVVKTGAAKSAITLSSLKCSGGNAARLFKSTLENDLKLSGWFKIAAVGVGVLEVRGTCSAPGTRLDVRCEVLNAASGRSYVRENTGGQGSEARRMAHELADKIVRAVKGVPGMASSRIVFVGARGRNKDLYICDADGGGMGRITKDGAVCLAPSWGPRNSFVTYTSFHGGFPDVYRIDMKNFERVRLAGYPGLNAGADVSPDGRSIVLTLSKDGNPDLYILSLGSRRLTRLTKTRFAAEASPTWSPDGGQIAFVSDKSGTPQVYVTGSRGVGQRRITFHGRENVAPDWGPKGKIAVSSRRGGRYRICVVDPATRAEQQLTVDAADYEDPAWAPDGRHIACARSVGYHSEIYVLDTLGDPSIRLTRLEGEWHSPAWSPE